jgi:hypothetical protein
MMILKLEPTKSGRPSGAQQKHKLRGHKTVTVMICSPLPGAAGWPGTCHAV